MHMETHFSPLAITYATALFELAEEQHVTAQIGQELEEIAGIMAAEPKLGVILSDPGISKQDRAGTLQRLFEGRVSVLLMKFLNLLNEKGRLNKLAEIAGAFAAILEEKSGRVEVDVTVAVELNEPTLAAVGQRVSAALKREAVVHQYVDENIIGGLILRVQDKLIDGSVRAQIAALRQEMLEARSHLSPLKLK